MTPGEKLLKAFELSDMANTAFRDGHRASNPELSEAELHQLYLEKRLQCQNRNY
ncbi:MAG: hypothetical protein LBR39_02575 [Coriobacteriales bacterium]|jgi:hypothetical protein|nr:hypothetical protein [Coriobacteriales bacterium]